VESAEFLDVEPNGRLVVRKHLKGRAYNTTNDLSNKPDDKVKADDNVKPVDNVKPDDTVPRSDAHERTPDREERNTKDKLKERVEKLQKENPDKIVEVTTLLIH
jgi:hypothetical protein